MESLGAELTYDCSVYRRKLVMKEGIKISVFDYDERTSWEYFIEDITSLIEEGGDSCPDLMCGLHVYVSAHEGWMDELQEKMYTAWFNWAEEFL